MFTPLINVPSIDDPRNTLVLVIMGLVMIFTLLAFFLSGSGRRDEKLLVSIKRFYFRVTNAVELIFFRQLKLMFFLWVGGGLLTFFLYSYVYGNINRAFLPAVCFLIGSILATGLVYLCDVLICRFLEEGINSLEKGENKLNRHLYQKSWFMGILFIGILLICVNMILLIFGIESLPLFPSLIFGVCSSAFFLVLSRRHLKQSILGFVSFREEMGDPERGRIYNQLSAVLRCTGDIIVQGGGTLIFQFAGCIIILVAAILLGADSLSNPWFLESYHEFAPAFALKLSLYPVLIMTAGVFALWAGMWQGVTGSKEKPVKLLGKGYWITQAATFILVFVISILFIVDPTRNSPDFRFPFAALTGMILGGLWTFVFYRYSKVLDSSSEKKSQSNPVDMLRSAPFQISKSLHLCFHSIILAVMALLIVVTIFKGNIAFTMYGISIMGVGFISSWGYFAAIQVFPTIIKAGSCVSGIPGNPDDEKRQKIFSLFLNYDKFTGRISTVSNLYSNAMTLIASISLFAVLISFSNILPSSMKISEGQLLLGGETVNFTDYNFIDILSALGIQLNIPGVFIGLLLGAAIPFLFSSIIMRTSWRIAGVVSGFQRMFFYQPGEKNDSPLPDHRKSLESLMDSIRKELTAPVLVVLSLPLIIGFYLGLAPSIAFLESMFIMGYLFSIFFLTRSYSVGEEDNIEIVSPFLYYLKENTAYLINIYIMLLEAFVLFILPLIMKINGNPVIEATTRGKNPEIRLPLVLLAMAVIGFALSFHYQNSGDKRKKDENQ